MKMFTRLFVVLGLAMLLAGCPSPPGDNSSTGAGSIELVASDQAVVNATFGDIDTVSANVSGDGEINIDQTADPAFGIPVGELDIGETAFTQPDQSRAEACAAANPPFTQLVTDDRGTVCSDGFGGVVEGL